VSADLREHTRALFMEPVLAAHDKAGFEVYCYSGARRPDETTARIRAAADAWRETSGQSDAELAETIRADRIDILVELTGHMGNNRLLVFARKPAPVQVAYPGYPNTTGLKTIDYCIADVDRDPPGVTETLYTEQLVRLPATSQCYRPSADAPAVGPAPALMRGHVTFCCFNKLVKVSPGMMQAWAAILVAVPRSRLMALAAGAGREDEAVREAFVRQGVPADRLDLVRPLKRMDYLWRYNQADIGLDTFPYNGHTTTLDGLWMGVPTVTLSGGTHVSREGAAMLSLLGLPQLIARSPREYIHAAVKLAMDLPRLQLIRGRLREKMRASPLTDAVRLTRELESAYRRMWAAWCSGADRHDDRR
jgi:protein O-GlcNAc transferase